MHTPIASAKRQLFCAQSSSFPCAWIRQALAEMPFPCSHPCSCKGAQAEQQQHPDPPGACCSPGIQVAPRVQPHIHPRAFIWQQHHFSPFPSSMEMGGVSSCYRVCENIWFEGGRPKRFHLPREKPNPRSTFPGKIPIPEVQPFVPADLLAT